MRKIMNGLAYDTETAMRLATYTSPSEQTGLNHVEQTLYRKKCGEYFLFSTVGLASVTPMTLREAMLWAEEHLSAYEYEAIFGPAPEEDLLMDVSYRLNAFNAGLICHMADCEGVPPSQIIEKLVDEKCFKH